MGCVVNTRWDIHEKVVIIDDEIIWFGSLNPLSHTNRTDEMMARVTGKPAALQLSAFMAVTTSVSADKADGLSVVGENPRCPDCGQRTTYRVGSYGPFWQCEDDCGWKQNAGRTNNAKTAATGAEALPKSGTPCPICGGPTLSDMGLIGIFTDAGSIPNARNGEGSGAIEWDLEGAIQADYKASPLRFTCWRAAPKCKPSSWRPRRCSASGSDSRVARPIHGPPVNAAEVDELIAPNARLGCLFVVIAPANHPRSSSCRSTAR